MLDAVLQAELAHQLEHEARVKRLRRRLKNKPVDRRELRAKAVELALAVAVVAPPVPVKKRVLRPEQVEAQRLRVKAWRKANRERYNAQRARWRAKRAKPKTRLTTEQKRQQQAARVRAWRAANPARRIAASRRAKAAQQAWRAKNPAKVKAMYARAKAKRKKN